MLMAGARDPWGKSSATINHGMEPEAKNNKNKQIVWNNENGKHLLENNKLFVLQHKGHCKIKKKCQN